MWSTTCWILDLVDIHKYIKLKREITDVQLSGVFDSQPEAGRSGREENGWDGKMAQPPL